MKAAVTAPPRDAPEGRWVLRGCIEIPCTYKICGLKDKKSELQKKLEMLCKL